MLKSFEYFYLLSSRLQSPLVQRVRRELFHALRSCPKNPAILDVGGRKSHYTIGLPASVTISDLPRLTQVQQKLNLGINDDIRQQTISRRSNVKEIVYDDMTKSGLAEDSFDIVVAVEVLEHVAEDYAFVANVRRILRPGGVFIMTTPNGDTVVNTNPDHKRHYTREQLRTLLGTVFPETEVAFAIRGGRFRTWGMKPWGVRRPVDTLRSMLGNVISDFQSSGGKLDECAARTRHLVARCQKPLVERVGNDSGIILAARSLDLKTTDCQEN